MPIEIRDSAEFERLLTRLAADVVEAAIFFRLHRDLRDSVNEFKREFNQSLGFWSLTLHAHLDAARLRLFRAYDQHGQALSLRSWLETIRDHPDVAARGSSGVGIQRDIARPDPKQLEHDLRAVGDTDPLVKKLVALRGTVGAHINARNVVAELRLEDRFALTYDEVGELVSRASIILNRYSGALMDRTWSTTMVGHDDFHHVLNAVRATLKRFDEELEAEISRARAEPCGA